MATMEKLYTVDEVAEYLKIDVQVIRRWLRKDIIKGVKIGSKEWRVKESDLQDFVNDNH